MRYHIIGEPVLSLRTTGEPRMRDFCAWFQPGSALSDVRALQLDYGFTEHAGGALIHEASSFGRYICQTEFSDGKLQSSEYVYND